MNRDSSFFVTALLLLTCEATLLNASAQGAEPNSAFEIAFDLRVADDYPVIVTGIVAATEDGSSAEEYTISVRHVLKGHVARRSFRVRLSGSSRPSNLGKERVWFLGETSASPVEFSADESRPVALAAFFEAMVSKDRVQELRRLLVPSADAAVALRCLHYIQHVRTSGPLAELDKEWPRSRRAEDLAAMIGHGSEDVSTLAIRLYADVVEYRALRRLQPLLLDRRESVRGTTAHVIAKSRDASLLPALREAIPSVDDSWLIPIIQELRSWGSLEIVPLLIPLLQRALYAERGATKVVAIEARRAIRAATGFQFPNDVARASRLWATAQTIPRGAEREAWLKRETSRYANPLGITVAESDDALCVTVRNLSDRSLLIAKRPERITIRGASGKTCHYPEPVRTPDDYMRLESGKELSWSFSWHLTKKERRASFVIVLFGRNGNEHGLNAWIGELEAKVKG